MMPVAQKKTVQQLKEKKPEDIMATVMNILPLMVAIFSFQFSVGLSLYWNTYTVFGIIQQYLVSGWGGFEVWLKRFTGRTDK